MSLPGGGGGCTHLRDLPYAYSQTYFWYFSMITCFMSSNQSLLENNRLFFLALKDCLISLLVYIGGYMHRHKKYHKIIYFCIYTHMSLPNGLEADLEK